MRKISMLAALTLSATLAAAPAAASQPLPLDQRIGAALDALRPGVQVVGRDYPPKTLAELMRETNVPAVSIAIIHEGRVVVARAFGQADRTSGRAATPDTLFQAASLSKPIAATAALRLVEQGRLQLDRPVNEQLTSWRVPPSDVAAGEPVTLRRLLTHTAGLTVSGFPGYAAGAPVPSVVQILDGTAPANTDPVRVDLQPGSQWRYSGGGITIAQLLMTDVAREPFPELMERLVLRPLHMSRSTFRQPLPAERLAETAVGHGDAGLPIAGGHHVHPEMAAAGLWTTPTDVVRWAIALSAAFNGAQGGVLRPETAAAMLTPGQGDWGLGVAVTGEGQALRYSHTGSNAGFRSMVIAFPRRGEGAVVMTNGDNGGAVIGPVLQAVGRVLGWPDSEPRMITPAAITAPEREAVVGRYGAGDFTVTVSRSGDTLMLAVGESPPFEILPQGRDAFVAPQNGMRLEFVRDPASGRVTAVTGAGMTLPRLP